MLEGCGDLDFLILFWVNKAIERLSGYALMLSDAIYWISRFRNSACSLCPFSQQDNPAGFVKEAIASEEEGYQIVGREVYQVGFAAVVLELG